MMKRFPETLRRFTAVELVVALSVIVLLLALGAYCFLKDRINFESGGGEKLPSGDVFSSADTDVVSPEAKEGETSGVEKNVSRDAAKKESSETLPPQPVAIAPQTVKITVPDEKEQEFEPFALYFFQCGSNAKLDDYQVWWSKKNNRKEVFAAGWNKKREQGINLSLYSYYLRRNSVFRSSPYRSYILRRRILSSRLKPFDEKGAFDRWTAKAHQQFNLCAKGGMVSFNINDKKYTGILREIGSDYIVIGAKKISLNDLPEPLRWRFSEERLEAKRREFIENESSREKEAYTKVQRERIRTIMHAEFPMLKNDSLISALEQEK